MMHENGKFEVKQNLTKRVRSTASIFKEITQARSDVDHVLVAAKRDYTKLQRAGATILDFDEAVSEIQAWMNGPNSSSNEMQANATGGIVVIANSFNNNRDSTIVNMSELTNSLNAIRPDSNDVAAAIKELADHVIATKNTKAGQLTEAVAAEIAKGEQDANKTSLGLLWENLKSAVATAGTLTSAVKTVDDLLRKWEVIT